jgi:tRNA modification GTPase
MATESRDFRSALIIVAAPAPTRHIQTIEAEAMAEGETIYALSSGRGPAGIAVIRVSGPAAGSAILRCTRRRDLPAPRRATKTTLVHPSSREPVDTGLVLWLPGPGSATGEDMAELHVHGGRAVVEAVLGALALVPELRLAEPGEFTRRAFLAGKLDLTAAEGIADLVAAETEAQRRQAVAQASGALAAMYDAWRDRLVRQLALIEAGIDFIDEPDVPADLSRRARPEIAALAADLARHLADGRRGERLREGLSVAIVGPPNVGKSSLLNALARRDVAIVSPRAGTTRDIVECHLDLGGYPLILADTAGLRALDPASADPIEAEGIRRALARAEAADLRLAVFEAGQQIPAEFDAWPAETTLVVANKIDRLPPGQRSGIGAIAVSAKTGEGLDRLVQALTDAARSALQAGDGAAITRARHREAVGHCHAALERALDQGEIELMAEELRRAATALARLTGRIDVEDLLDRIFAEFCIGK